MLVPSHVRAQSDATPVCRESKQCADAESEDDIRTCLFKLYKKADDLLNDEYAGLREDIRALAARIDSDPEAYLNELKDAQRQWIAFRDKTCELEAGLAGGSSAGEFRSECLCLTTYQRINDFRRMRRDNGPDPAPRRLGQ